MASDVSPQGTGVRAGQQLSEYPASSRPGLQVLVLSIVALVAGGVVLPQASGKSHAVAATLTTLGIVLLVVGSFALGGLTPITPGRARVVQLFGRYRGTIRESGLQWVNPFTRRISVSTRIRNQESAQAKVNDADGNPIEIAAVVVWQVNDTAQAIYAVDNFVEFVTIQAETAVRHIAIQLPLRQPRQPASCRCGTTPTRSPSG